MSTTSRSRAASIFLLWMILEPPFRRYVTGPVPNPWLNVSLSIAMIVTIWAGLRAAEFPQEPFGRSRWLLWALGLILVIIIIR